MLVRFVSCIGFDRQNGVVSDSALVHSTTYVLEVQELTN